MFVRLSAIPTLATLWLVNTLFKWVNVRFAWKLGENLGSLIYYLMKGRRSIVANNLSIVSKFENASTVSPKLIKQVFRRNGAHLTCSVKTYGMQPADLARHITLDIDPFLQETIEKQSGAIICLAHMGNWEILSKISSLVDPPLNQFGAVYRPLDNTVVDNFVAKQREQHGCKMFAKSSSISKISAFVREGGILGILADQRSGSKKNARPFFGVDSERSKLPAVLYKRTQAPMFSLAVYSEQTAHWTIKIQKINNLPTSDIEVEEVVAKITQAYESSFSNNLLDVFWLHRYWRT